MSIQTDLASLEIIAKVYRSQDVRESFQQLVTTLHNEVPYFDWVGIYLIEGEEMNLTAASNFDDLLTWDTNSELRIPIQDPLAQEDIGKIVVRSRQHICFDVTDVSTLETLATEISSRLTLN